MQKYNNRSEVPEEYKWDLTEYFKDEKEFEETYNNVEKLAKELKSYIGCTKDAYKLYEFLQKELEATSLWENLYVYSYLIHDQELGVSDSIKRKSKCEQLYTLIGNNTSFLSNELLKLKKDEYESLFKTCSDINKFKFDLDKIYREKEHILSENEEVIINKIVNSVNTFDDISSSLFNQQHDYGKIKIENNPVVIASNNYRLLMKNKDENIRKKVYKQFNQKIDQYSTTNAGLLNCYVNLNNTVSKLKKYKNAWNKKLFNLNISDKVFNTLLKTTEDNLDILHKYYQLKCDVLGKEKLRMYDLSLDLAKTNKEYCIEDAQKIIREALEPLGKEFLEKYDKMIENRYIDYCQYKGKYSGGYSYGTMSQDSRILMSYNYNLESISTIAHEAGHNIHHQFIRENNELQYSSTYLIVAEIVSLVNECLLSHHLVNKGTTKEEKLAGLANIMEVIARNLYGAVREAKLEQDIYKEVDKGGTITKDLLDNLSRKSIKKYYGSSVIYDKYTKNAWVTRSHYYMDFYLYNYAICISIATDIASKIISGDKEILNKYYEFLKIGTNMWPIDIFAVLGVNLENENVYQNAINYFDNLINKFYEIYNQEEV